LQQKIKQIRLNYSFSLILASRENNEGTNRNKEDVLQV